jgi:hypothetical protein
VQKLFNLEQFFLLFLGLLEPPPLSMTAYHGGLPPTHCGSVPRLPICGCSLFSGLQSISVSKTIPLLKMTCGYSTLKFRKWQNGFLFQYQPAMHKESLSHKIPALELRLARTTSLLSGAAWLTLWSCPPFLSPLQCWSYGLLIFFFVAFLFSPCFPAVLLLLLWFPMFFISFSL